MSQPLQQNLKRPNCSERSQTERVSPLETQTGTTNEKRLKTWQPRNRRDGVLYIKHGWKRDRALLDPLAESFRETLPEHDLVATR